MIKPGMSVSEGVKIVFKLLFVESERGLVGDVAGPREMPPARGLVGFQEVVSNTKNKDLGFPWCPHGDFQAMMQCASESGIFMTEVSKYAVCKYPGKGGGELAQEAGAH